MANFARIAPSKRFGLYANPEEAWFGPTLTALGTTIGWTAGAPLSYATTGANQGFLSEGGWAAAGAAVNPATTILGFAAEPYTSTGSFTTAVGTEQVPAVGAGSTINGVRRRFYPVGPQLKFTGTLDTSGSPGTTALSISDVGSYFLLRAIRTDTGASIGALPNTTVAANLVVWILDRTGAPALGAAPNASSLCLVTKLVDPPGAKTTDTPSAGVNSGQSLVEFMVVNALVAGGVLIGPQL